MAEKLRPEQIQRICDELEDLGVSCYLVEPIRSCAESIFYCRCGHERTQHGNGIVDRRCFASGCGCSAFRDEDGAGKGQER